VRQARTFNMRRTAPHQSTIIATRAVVLGVYESGESSRIVSLLTDSAGLVWGLAQGARNLSSKQRLHLKQLSIIEAALVLGKRTRVRSALEVTSTASLLLANQQDGRRAIETAQRLCRLLQRIVPQHERDLRLCAVVENFIHAILQDRSREDGEEELAVLAALELLTVLRILHALGYVGNNSITVSLLEDTDYSQMTTTFVHFNRIEILNVVNDSLKSSML
jgi:recombinational DNA repair protein (RecF pathway)